MSKLRSRLTYANVMATIAVFLALGGSSYAALRIASPQIVDNSIRSKDIRNNEVRGKDVRQRTITGADVKDDALGGEDVVESTLGKVPQAGTSFGPFRLELFCQYLGGEDVVAVSSTEDHAVVTWTFPFDDGTVHHFYANDQGSAAINMASSSKASAYSKPVEGWALARSGFRMHFSLWFGRGILDADNSTCSFGGELRRG